MDFHTLMESKGWRIQKACFCEGGTYMYGCHDPMFPGLRFGPRQIKRFLYNWLQRPEQGRRCAGGDLYHFTNSDYMLF